MWLLYPPAAGSCRIPTLHHTLNGAHLTVWTTKNSSQLVIPQGPRVTFVLGHWLSGKVPFLKAV